MAKANRLAIFFVKRHWQLLLLIALVLAFPIGIRTYFVTRVGILIAIYAINITGMTLLARYAGVISLGHSAFFAFGAYMSAILTVKMGLNPWLSMVIAAGITVAFANIFAAPFLRLRLVYLAMATLGLGEAVFLMVKDLKITGGVNGIPGIPYLRVGQIVIREDWQLFYLIWGLAIFLVFMTENIGKSRLGRAFHAIRTNETAAQAMGINVKWELNRVFSFSALVSALSGSMLAHFITFIGPEFFTVNFSFSLLIIVVIGGANIWGALVTTIVLTGFSEVFRGAQDFSMGLYALILIGAFFFFPEGLAVLFPQGYKRNNRGEILTKDPEPLCSSKYKPLDSHIGVQNLGGKQGNLLELINISKYFGGTAALSNVSATVGYNQIFGIIGPNGAGKTTLLNVINGFLSPQGGHIIFRNQDLTGKPPHIMAHFGLGRTFQIAFLFKGMTVLENVMVGCHIKANAGILVNGLNIGPARREERMMLNMAMKSLDLLGLGNRAYDIVDNLPYGEQKLVELARTLAMEPSLLLLDEPASGLNSVETKALSNILFRIRERGTTIILVEHNMSMVMGISDSVLVLDFGRPIALGTPGEVSKNEAVIKAYLGKETSGA